MSDFLNHRILKFDAQEKFVAAFGSLGAKQGQFHHPWGLAVDSRDRIYVADMSNHRFQILSAEGKFIATYGRYRRGTAAPAAPQAPGGFDHPKGISVFKDTVWLAVPGNNTIERIVVPTSLR